MFGFGASVFGKAPVVFNAVVSPATVTIPTNAVGLVGQVGSSIPAATYSKISGAAAVSVGADGKLTLSSGLANGATAVVVIRAVNAALGLTVDTSVTLTAANLAAKPVNLVAPLIAGTPLVGRTLTAVPGTWSNDDGLGLTKLVNTLVPTIIGFPMVGSLLTASTGTFV